MLAQAHSAPVRAAARVWEKFSPSIVSPEWFVSASTVSGCSDSTRASDKGVIRSELSQLTRALRGGSRVRSRRAGEASRRSTAREEVLGRPRRGPNHKIPTEGDRLKR